MTTPPPNDQPSAPGDAPLPPTIDEAMSKTWAERARADAPIAFRAAVRAAVEGVDERQRDAGCVVAAFLLAKTQAGEAAALLPTLTEVMETANHHEWFEAFGGSSSGAYMAAYAQAFNGAWIDTAKAFLDGPATPAAYLAETDEREDRWRAAMFAVGVTTLSSAGTASRGPVVAGATYVVFPYCVSVVLLTFRLNSGVKVIPPGGSRLMAGLPYALVTLLFGWWGIPWGPIYSLQCLVRALQGGIDVTAAVDAGAQIAGPPITGEYWVSPTR